MVHEAAVAGGALVGAGVGWGAGWLSVVLERIERLEEEEHEERNAYQVEAAAAAEPLPPWRPERYGWTWLEWLVAPALGAGAYGVFVAHENELWPLLLHLSWVAVLLHMALFDLKHRLILDRVTYPAVLLALAVAPLSPGLTIVAALIGAFVVFLFFWVQNRIVGDAVMGMGDAKLGALVGAVTGLGVDGHLGAAYAVVTAVLLGGIIAVLLLVTRLRRLKDPIPYGPFLCAGAALVLFWGPGHI